ncbi:MAG TPA: hypothetical protein VL360_07810 [Gammaproteobacteria bacterium]|nr:hypothetical protein [Gammaproteobacteria bacterium]
MFARLFKAVTNYIWPSHFSLETSFQYTWIDNGKRKNQYRSCVPCESIEYLEQMYGFIFETIKYLQIESCCIHVKGQWQSKEINQVFDNNKSYYEFIERVIASSVLTEFGMIHENGRSNYFADTEHQYIMEKLNNPRFCSQIHGFYQRHFESHQPHIITNEMREILLSLIRREISELGAENENNQSQSRLG